MKPSSLLCHLRLFCLPAMFGLSLVMSAQAAPFLISTNAKLRDHGFPSVAFDGTNYLVGLQIPNATNSQVVVAAQFVSQSGALVGSQILVSTNGDPTVVGFDGTNYLVSWDEGGTGTFVFGQFVNKAGTKIGSPFQIAQVASPTGNSGLRAVAFGGTSYLVLFKEGNEDIYGQRVSTAGGLVGGPFKINSVAGGSPAVAFDGTNFLVSWATEQIAMTNLVGRFVSQSGINVGSEFVIDGSPNAGQRKVLFDGTRYVVAFIDGVEDSGTEDVFARFVSPSGIVSTNRITVSVATGAQTAPSLAFDGTNYLFTWNDWLGSTNMSLKGRFIDAAGNPFSSEFTIMGAQGGKLARFAHVIFDGRQFFVVTELGNFNTNTSSFTNSDLYATFISPLPRGTFPLAITSGSAWGGSAAFDGTNYLVAIEGNQTNRTSPTAQLFSTNGTLINARLSLGGEGGLPAVAFDGANYLMAWEDTTARDGNSVISGQFISPSGALVRTRLAIGAGIGGQKFGGINNLVFDGSNFLAVWEDGRNGSANSDIYGQLVTPAGTLAGPEIPITTEAERQRAPAVAFDGTNSLVVWQSRRSGSPELWDTYGRFVSRAGGPGTQMLISQSPSARYNPTSIAFDGTNYLVVWSRDIGPGFPSPDDWDIYARLVTRSGSFVGNEFPITTAPGSQPFASVAYDGANYLVSWLDSTTASGKSRFFSRAGVPLTAEFSLFGSQGTRTQLGSFFFDGSRGLALTTYIELSSFSQFTNGNVYGLILPQTRLDFAAPVANGQVPLRFTGMPGVTYAIQATTNLVSANMVWTTVTTSNSLSGTFNFTDTNATGYSRRFYRALLP